MKYEFTFAEMAEIFTMVSKIEEKVLEVKKAQNRYTKASEAFDGTIGTPEAEEMINAFDAREKVEKAYRAAAKKAIGVLGITPEGGYEERSIIAESKSVHRMDGFVFSIQRFALECVKYINY